MLEYHYSLEHADKVLSILKQRWPQDNEAYTYAWSNCREQGYFIQSFTTKVGAVFAQQRNSDAVLVIAGPSCRFDITTHMPSDSLWKNGRIFCEDVDAAEFIIAELS